MPGSRNPLPLAGLVPLLVLAALAVAPGSSPAADEPPTPVGGSPTIDPTVPVTREQPRGVQTLQFLLPPQHVDHAVTGEVRHFYLRGWTERLSDNCDETWCGSLVTGERKRASGIHKTLELAPDPLGGCDREWIVLKSRRKPRFERYCLTGENIFLEREQGFSGAATDLHRDFLNDGSAQASPINDGYVWARTKEAVAGLGLTNTFKTRVFQGCTDETVEELDAATAAVFHGPFNLKKHRDRRLAAEILGPHPAGDEIEFVKEMRTLADNLGRPGIAVHVLIRREFWGAHSNDKLCADRADKEPCFEFSEDYISARVGRRPLNVDPNSSTVGRIAWQIRRSIDQGGPHEVWRRSLFIQVHREEDSYLLLREGACLGTSSSRSRREIPLTGPMPARPAAGAAAGS